MKPSRPVLPALLALSVVLSAASPGAGAAEKIPITTASKEAMSMFVDGRRLVDNLRLTDAIPYFQKAVEKDPHFALAHLYLAQTAPTAKEFFAAISRADQAASGVSKGEQLYIRGFKAGSYGDPATQLKTYQELASEYPADERAQTLLGTSLFVVQDYTKAAEHLKKATDIAPEFAPAYNMLGYAYKFLEKYGEAEATFRRYTELLPTDPNPFDSYAELLLKMGRFDDAIAQYQKALAVDPHFANSFTGIAACLMYQNRHDEALAELQKLLDNARNDGETRFALFSRGVVYQDAGRPEMALSEIEKERAVALKTGDQASLSGDLALMGNILLHAGKAQEALEKFNASYDVVQKSSLASEVKANNVLIHHYNVAKAMLLKGDVAGAKSETAQYRKGAEAKKSAIQIRFSHELAGLIALQEKNYSGAIEELKQANQQDPSVLYHLALACQAGGNTAEAREYATRAAKFNGLPAMNSAFVRLDAEKLLSAL